MEDNVEPIFKDAKSFSLHIERQVLKNKSSHMEEVLKYCEENYIDPEDITKLISKPLMEKIKTNFIDLNYFPKTATLDKLL